MYQITNQTLTQTVDAIQDLDRRVSEIDDGLLWRAKDSEKLGGYTADHFAERVPDATKGNLAAFDETGNLVDSGAKTGDFALIGQHGVVPYTHVKNGTVHSLAGAAGTVIRFRATADFEFGDSWSLGGKPVSVTYQGGEELLPTAVLAGDCVMGVVEGSAIRLALQMPVPQEAVPGFTNGDFRAGHVINQRNRAEYTTQGYTIDGYRIQVKAGGTVSLGVCNGITPSGDAAGAAVVQGISISEKTGTKLTLSVELGEMTGKWYVWCNIHGASGPEIKTFNLRGITKPGVYSLPVTLPDGAEIAYFGVAYDVEQTGAHHVRVLHMKPEFGSRFTGWTSADPAIELAKCQSRQIVLGPQDIRASYVNVNDIMFFVPTPVMLRRSPNLSDGVVCVKSLNGVVQDGFAFQFEAVSNGVRVVAVKNKHGLSDAMLYLNSALFDANF